jgi:hypothetical protein
MTAQAQATPNDNNRPAPPGHPAGDEATRADGDGVLTALLEGGALARLGWTVDGEPAVVPGGGVGTGGRCPLSALMLEGGPARVPFRMCCVAVLLGRTDWFCPESDLALSPLASSEAGLS